MSLLKEHKITGKFGEIWNWHFFICYRIFLPFQSLIASCCDSLQCHKLLKSSLVTLIWRVTPAQVPLMITTQKVCSIGAVGPTPSPDFQSHWVISHILYPITIAAADIHCLKLSPSVKLPNANLCSFFILKKFKKLPPGKKWTLPEFHLWFSIPIYLDCFIPFEESISTDSTVLNLIHRLCP